MHWANLKASGRGTGAMLNNWIWWKYRSRAKGLSLSN